MMTDRGTHARLRRAALRLALLSCLVSFGLGLTAASFAEAEAGRRGSGLSDFPLPAWAGPNDRAAGVETVVDSPTSPECSSPSNPIVAENCLLGSDDWQVPEPSFSIAGFGLPSSVNAGEAIDFYVSTDAPRFELRIFRSGNYAGKGARLVTTVEAVPGTVQPACHDDPLTGLRSCSNWSPSYRLEIPSEWVSGVYFAVLVRSDDGRRSGIPFIVRDDGRRSEILYQSSLSTYQAYNNFGGKSLYSFNSGACITVTDSPRAAKVSLARPHIVPPMDPTSYFRVEYPMVFWLEGQGYDVSYSTNFDTHRSGTSGQHNALLDHRVFMAVGHDEYWSREMREAMTQARDAGVHLAYFTGNTGYWKIRMEPDPWTSAADLVMVTYKTAEGGPADPSGDPTSVWRDVDGPAQPENELIGIQFIGQNDTVFFPFRVTSELAGDRFFRNTGLENMPPGGFVDIGSRLVGWEWDAETSNGLTPPGIAILGASPAYGEIVTGAGASYIVGRGIANASRYTAPSGAIVFAAGTIQWSWGLAIVEPDARIQQMTYNLLADMGLQPATPSTSLVLDGTSVAEPVAVPADFQSPEATAALVISEVRSIVNDDTVLIEWRTDRPATGETWLVSSAGSSQTRLEAGLPAVYQASVDGLSHQMSFSSLEPTTTYHYVVSGSAKGGVFGLSAIHEFHTPSTSLLQAARRAAERGLKQAVCSVKPAVRPAYSWVRTHMPFSVLTGFATLGAALAYLVWRSRRLAKGRA
jgi:hypothetical protein